MSNLEVPMKLDLETAVRTLVVVSIAQSSAKLVRANLIVAVLARRFSSIPEEEVGQLVDTTILEVGGIIDRPAAEAAQDEIRYPTTIIPAPSLRLQ